MMPSAPRGQVIDDVQIEVARPVPDLTATQLFKDDPVDGGNLRLFRQQRFDPEPGLQPRCVEILDHGEACAKKSDTRQTISGKRLSQRVGDMEKGDIDPRRNAVEHLVHGVRTEQQAVGTA